MVTQCLQCALLGPGELLWTLTATSCLSGMFSFGFLFAKPAAAVSQDQAREETTLGKEEQDLCGSELDSSDNLGKQW